VGPDRECAGNGQGLTQEVIGRARENATAATSFSVLLDDFLTPHHITMIFLPRKHLSRVEIRIVGADKGSMLTAVLDRNRG